MVLCANLCYKCAMTDPFEPATLKDLTGCNDYEAPAKAGSAAMTPAQINVDRISHVAPGDTLIDVI